MTVSEVTGDLFNPAWNFQAIGHGVNCKGVMGSGIAPLFKKRWPPMYDHYRDACAGGFLLPGQVIPWQVSREGNKWVYNIASQFQPGADARITFLRAGLEYVRFHMKEKNVERLGLPRIGAGIGGLDYEDVRDTIYDVFDRTSLNVTIVSL